MLHENNIYFKMLRRFYMLIKNDNAYSKKKLTPLCNNCKTKKEKGNHIARTPWLHGQIIDMEAFLSNNKQT